MNVNKEITNRMDKIAEEVGQLNKLLKRYVREEDVIFRCDNCSSSFVYIRRKDKKLLCRKCGNIQDIDIEGDEKYE